MYHSSTKPLLSILTPLAFGYSLTTLHLCTVLHFALFNSKSDRILLSFFCSIGHIQASWPYLYLAAMDQELLVHTNGVIAGPLPCRLSYLLLFTRWDRVEEDAGKTGSRMGVQQ